MLILLRGVGRVFAGATKNADSTRWMIPRRHVEQFAMTYSPSERADLRRNWSTLYAEVFGKSRRKTPTEQY